MSSLRTTPKAKLIIGTALAAIGVGVLALILGTIDIIKMICVFVKGFYR